MTNSYSQQRKFSNGNVCEWKTPQLGDAEHRPEHAGMSEEEHRQQAFDQAYNEGYAAGKEQGLLELEQRKQVLENFLSALARPFDDQSEEIAEYLAQLAGRIAKGLVRRELRDNPETLLAMVRDTVSALNSSEHEITIHLNPNNAPVIRDLIHDECKEQRWRIIDDPMISNNNCKVSCVNSVIDADLDQRISMIITQFVGDERNGKRE